MSDKPPAEDEVRFAKMTDDEVRFANKTLRDAALRALEREAGDNPDAATLWAIIHELPVVCQTWHMLEVLSHFDGRVRSRPALISVLLRELSAAFPVPKSLMH